MKRPLALAALVVSVVAYAGEKCVGIIVASDGGAVSNATTGYGSAGCAITAVDACACEQAFGLGPAQKVTIQSDSAVIVGADYPVDAGNGLSLTAGQIFPTSTSSQKMRTALPDGGSYAGGLVWCIQPPGAAATVKCKVMVRTGTE